MNAERLLTTISKIGDDPDRIQQLRKVAVALATSGKLNGVATSLRPDVLIKHGALPKQTKFAEVAEGQVPEFFSDPSRFAPLGALARIEKGQTGIQQARPGPFPLVVTAVERASCDHFDFEGAAAIVPLVSSAGHGKASLNRLHYQEGQFALGTILVALFPHDPNLISARFLFEYLSAFKDELLVSRMTGTANVTLTVGRIADVPIPLIPPEIQSKVDELMALCDRLASARGKREATRDRLTAASLGRLNVPDPDTFRDDARFALDVLPALTARPDQIKQLRQTILNLAVRGMLLPQNPNDEPAFELLKRIAVEKAQLVREKEIRRKAPQKPISLQDEPFSVPNGWLWCRLGDLFNLVTDGAHHTPRYLDSGVPFLSVKDVSSGRIAFDNVKYISEEQHADLCQRCCPEHGDILLTKVGTTGIAVPIDTERQFSIFVSLALLKFSKQNLSQKYLCHLINSPFVRQQSAENTQGIGNQNLVLRLINDFVLPIPPLTEQHRIVAKVNELMALCDQLEASLTTGDDTRRRLLDALLADALAPDGERELEAAE
jgi:type I restriction enzyme S subunit